MLIQWSVISGVPLLYVTADTKVLCMRLASEISSMLPSRVAIAPKQDSKTFRWSQGFSLAGMDCDTAAGIVAAAVALGSAILQSTQLTPPMGTPLRLIKMTR